MSKEIWPKEYIEGDIYTYYLIWLQYKGSECGHSNNLKFVILLSAKFMVVTVCECEWAVELTELLFGCFCRIILILRHSKCMMPSASQAITDSAFLKLNRRQLTKFSTLVLPAGHGPLRKQSKHLQKKNGVLM